MITITSLDQAPKMFQDFDLIISILDPGKKFQDPVGPHHLIKHFEDTEHPNEKELLAMHMGVRSILSWVMERKPTLETKILVHCHAGVSRSSAIAWLILIQLGMDPKEAFQTLYKKRSQIWPNTQVMQIGGEFLSQPPEFYKLVTQVNTELSDDRKGYLGYGF